MRGSVAVAVNSSIHCANICLVGQHLLDIGLCSLCAQRKLKSPTTQRFGSVLLPRFHPAREHNYLRRFEHSIVYHFTGIHNQEGFLELVQILKFWHAISGIPPALGRQLNADTVRVA